MDSGSGQGNLISDLYTGPVDPGSRQGNSIKPIPMTNFNVQLTDTIRSRHWEARSFSFNLKLTSIPELNGSQLAKMKKSIPHMPLP